MSLTFEGFYVADRNLYLNRDMTRALEESDPEIAFVLAVPGTRIPEARARELGLLDEQEAQSEQSEQSEPAETAENKAVEEAPATKVVKQKAKS